MFDNIAHILLKVKYILGRVKKCFTLYDRVQRL